MSRYRGIVWFRNGNCKKTSTITSNRSEAEREAIRLFEREMQYCVNEYSKPTRYEVVEVD